MTQDYNEPKEARNPETTPDVTGYPATDIPHLMEDIGKMLDTTFGSINDMIESVSTITGKIAENVSNTINSDAVQDMIKNVNAASESVVSGINSAVEGLNTTLNSEQLKETFNGIEKFWNSLLETTGTNANIDSVQQLFANVGNGLGQLTEGVRATVFQPQPQESKIKKSVEIPFSSKSLPEASEPEKN